MVDDVVQHQAIEDNVERSWREVQRSGVADVGLVGAAVCGDARDSIRVGVDGDQAERWSRKEMAAWAPAAPDCQHLPVSDPQPAREQGSFPLLHMPVLDVECARCADPVEQVPRSMGRDPWPRVHVCPHGLAVYAPDPPPSAAGGRADGRTQAKPQAGRPDAPPPPHALRSPLSLPFPPQAEVPQHGDLPFGARALICMRDFGTLRRAPPFGAAV